MQKITDYQARAVAELYEQYRYDVNFQRLLRALSAGQQDVENMLWDVGQSRLLDVATGHALDQKGSIVGEPRLGRDDTDYRATIKFRQALRNANGTMPDLLYVARVLSGASTARFAERQEVPELALFTDADPGPSFQGLVDPVAAGGVRVTLTLHTAGEEPLACKEQGGPDPGYGRPFAEADGSVVGGMICEGYQH
jgi:hypothetical protein